MSNSFVVPQDPSASVLGASQSSILPSNSSSAGSRSMLQDAQSPISHSASVALQAKVLTLTLLGELTQP